MGIFLLNQLLSAIKLGWRNPLQIPFKVKTSAKAAESSEAACSQVILSPKAVSAVAARSINRCAASLRSPSSGKFNAWTIPRQVPGQRQRAVLQYAAFPASLGAADQLFSSDGDLIIRGDLETNRVLFVSLLLRRAVHRFHWDLQTVEPQDEGLRKTLVAFEHTAGKARVGFWTYDRIGQLIGVEDGAPTGRTADDPPASAMQLILVDIRNTLGIT